MSSTLHSRAYARFRSMLVGRREAAGLTQAAVAARLGRPQSFVSKYENGERRIDVVEFLQIAEAIGFDPGLILKELGRR